MFYFRPAESPASAPDSTSIALAQMIVEGPRWQMVPAYVLTGLFFLVWLLQDTTLAGRPVNRLAVGLAIGLGTLALVISAALPIVSPVFRFPRPSGPTRLAR